MYFYHNEAKKKIAPVWVKTHFVDDLLTIITPRVFKRGDGKKKRKRYDYQICL